MTKTLTCHDNRRSFYGKARQIIKPNRILCQSYNTIVGYIENGIFHRTWNGYSATTMRYVNSFLIENNVAGGGKKWWDSLPIETIN